MYLKVFLVILFAYSTFSENIVEVTIKQGVVAGRLNQTLFKNLNYFSFLGIPYAEPPVGTLRFLPPEEHKGWTGTYEALEKKPICLQFISKGRLGEPFGISGSEDCLYLNVFTPNLEGSSAVVVFDYNDNFRTSVNSSDVYSPDFFMEENVVVVTINYRLGCFGYLTTEDDVIPPNAGIKDFIEGLKWIKNNIAKFGGDPTRVTVMGNSGGATIADILLYSEAAKGLFSAATIQSGSALEPIYLFGNRNEAAFKLGNVLNITASDSNTLLKQLQEVDAKTIMDNEIKVYDEKLTELYQISYFPFAPTVEKDVPGAVLVDLPENAKIVNDVPVLIGMTSREGLDLVSQLLYEPKLVLNMLDSFTFSLPIRSKFKLNRESKIYENLLKELKEFYFKDGYFGAHNLLEYSVYIGDILHSYAFNYAAKKISADKESPTFYFMFDFRGLINENSEYMSKRTRSPLQLWGATITDELCYLHLCRGIVKKYKELLNAPSEQVEIKVLKKMVRLWTNFAKTRNPTPEDDDLLKGFTWKPVNNTDLNYLHINKHLKMKTNPLGKREVFWDNFYEKYSKMAVDGVVGDIHDEL